MNTKRYFSLMLILFSLSQITLVSICEAKADKARRKKTPQMIARSSIPSTVVLSMENEDGPVSMGSGFFIKSNVIATNAHVIKGATIGYARFANQKKKYDIIGVVADSKIDIALLYINDIKAPFLRIGDSKAISIADPIYVVGNPNGLEGSFSTGIVSAIRKNKSGASTVFDIQFTAPISPGSSGGPTLNSSGEVIGIATKSYYGGQNLNFAIPASYISRLLKETPIPLYKYTRLENAKCSDNSNEIISDDYFPILNLIMSVFVIGFVAGYFIDWLSNKLGKKKISIKTQNYTVHITSDNIRDKDGGAIESGSELQNTNERNAINIHLK
jgi:hypothetical protein